MTREQGQIVNEIIYSPALIERMRLQIYLPPRYGELDIDYPAVYLLHPWGMDEGYFKEHLHLHLVADRLIHNGALPPFIAVMPQGDKSFFINAENPGGDFSMMMRLDPDFFAGALEGYGDYGDYVLKDVIGHVEHKYDVRSDPAGRVIAGISMGGAGAAALAFQEPERFGAVGIHSPALFNGERLGPPWIFGLGDEKAFAARDPVHLASQLPRDTDLRIYLDCGREDDLSPLVDKLHNALLDRGIRHKYRSRPGRHQFAYWDKHLAEYLGFYAAGW